MHHHIITHKVTRSCTQIAFPFFCLRSQNAQKLPDLSGLVSEGVTDKVKNDKIRENAVLHVRAQLSQAYQDDQKRVRSMKKTSLMSISKDVRESSKAHFLRLENSLRHSMDINMQDARVPPDERILPLTKRGQKRELVIIDNEDEATERKRHCVIKQEGDHIFNFL